jgi:hypothetical protein
MSRDWEATLAPNEMNVQGPGSGSDFGPPKKDRTNPVFSGKFSGQEN